MAPKPIKSMGKVRKEQVLPAPERDTLASKLSAEGVTSTPEFIKAIDEQAESGEKEKVAEVMLRAISDKTSENCRTYTAAQIQSAVITSATEAFEDESFVAGLKFRKQLHDDLLDSSKSIKKRYAGKPAVVLNEEESQEFHALMDSQGEGAWANTDQTLVEEVGFILAFLRKSVLAKLGVQQENIPEQMVDPDEEGGDFQMGDAEAFLEGIRGATYATQKHVCCGKCGGHKE